MRPSWLLAIALALLPMSAARADYPDRVVRIIVPVAAGGGADIITRLIAERLSEQFGQQFIVENRTGGGTTIGTKAVIASPPDGYTLLMVSSAHVINPAVWKKLPYDSVKDFAPVTLVANVPNSLCIHPSVPAKNVRELVALARSKPDQLTYATPGRGTSSHLAKIGRAHV